MNLEIQNCEIIHTIHFTKLQLTSCCQELRDPLTGKGVEAGGVTVATWQWYIVMDAVLQGQLSISPPLVVASNLTATTSGTVSLLASAPAAEEVQVSQPVRTRSRDRDSILSFLKEQAEREKQREREAVAREEDREQAVTEEAEQYLTLRKTVSSK